MADTTRTAASAARTPLRSILAPAALVRMAIGWLAVALLPVAGGSPLALAPTVAVIVVCAFGVVHQAEHLAARLGDPLGTLVLTLSIVLIEVVLIVAVMLGPGDHATIARDSVLAVSMIILNLVVGLALLVGGLRHGALHHNRSGTSAYLVVLTVLLAVTFGMPLLAGNGGTFTTAQAIAAIVLTAGLYAFFLWRQTGAQASDFVEAAATSPTGERAAAQHPATRTVVRAHRRELLTRLALLVATVSPIVLLSHDMATMLDVALALLHAPTALSGILIAAVVFLPEAITSVRAGLRGEIQRVSNLCHGALVSTVGLTVPAVLAVGLLTGQSVVLAVDGTGMLLLAVSLLLSVTTFSGARTSSVHGAAHLALFAMFGITVFV